MSFENLKAGIALLLEQTVHQPEDLHEVQETLREELAELKSLGMPLPEDLVKLEADLSSFLERQAKEGGSKVR